MQSVFRLTARRRPAGSGKACHRRGGGGPRLWCGASRRRFGARVAKPAWRGAPLWIRPARFCEIESLLSEGRAVLNGRTARDGLDFARAAASLGVSRGFREFERFGFLMRAGKAYLATPLGRRSAAPTPGARLVADLDAGGWLDRVRRVGRNDEEPGAARQAIKQGRVRVRRKKRGPKTKKGRNRFHTDWKEPKLLILYVVGDDGRPSQTWAPIIDGTLRGPEAVFALLLSYARQIGLNAADKVLFIADGAPWIWQRIQRLIAALGLSPTQVLGLIDFYHAAKQLSDAVKLRRWSATQRTRWLNRTRGLLKRARVDEVITALRELCRGRTAGKIRTHLNYFLKNRHRFAYTTMVGLGLPQGSGAVESAIRRVINLRIKGASIYWLPESVDAILLLRSFYKSGRWNCLQRMAMTPVGVSA